MRRENASVAGLARQLGSTWRTVGRAVTPLLQAMAAAKRPDLVEALDTFPAPRSPAARGRQRRALVAGPPTGPEFLR